MPVHVSISAELNASRKEYYARLNDSQHQLDVTDWLSYFIGCLLKAIESAKAWVAFILRKADFYGSYKDDLSGRQLKALEKMFAVGPAGFKGGMNAKKYLSINRVSRATATRNLQDLARMGALKKVGAGRTTRYELPFS